MGTSHRCLSLAGSAKRILFRVVRYCLCALLLGMWPCLPRFVYGQDGDIAEGKLLPPDLRGAVIESQAVRVVFGGQPIGINIVTVQSGTGKDLPREDNTVRADSSGEVSNIWCSAPAAQHRRASGLTCSCGGSLKPLAAN